MRGEVDCNSGAQWIENDRCRSLVCEKAIDRSFCKTDKFYGTKTIKNYYLLMQWKGQINL